MYKNIFVSIMSVLLSLTLFPGQGSQNKAGEAMRIRVHHAIDLAYKLLGESKNVKLDNKIHDRLSGEERSIRELWMRELSPENIKINLIAEEQCYLAKDLKVNFEDRCYTYKEIQENKLGLPNFVNVVMRTKAEVNHPIYFYEETAAMFSVSLNELVAFVLHETGHHIGISHSNVYSSITDLNGELSFELLLELSRFSSSIEKENAESDGNQSKTLAEIEVELTNSTNFRTMPILNPGTGEVMSSEKKTIVFSDSNWNQVDNQSELERKNPGKTICRIAPSWEYGFLDGNVIYKEDELLLESGDPIVFKLMNDFYNEPVAFASYQSFTEGGSNRQKIEKAHVLFMSGVYKNKKIVFSCTYYDDNFPSDISAFEAVQLLKQELSKYKSNLNFK